LNELALSRPSDVISRYSTSAKIFGSTQIDFGFLMGLVSLDLGLTTLSSCFPGLAGDCQRPARPNLAHVDQDLPFPLAQVERGNTRGIFHETDDGEFSFWMVLIFSQASFLLER
jgi:hypothetical protein